MSTELQQQGVVVAIAAHHTESPPASGSSGDSSGNGKRSGKAAPDPAKAAAAVATPHRRKPRLREVELDTSSGCPMTASCGDTRGPGAEFVPTDRPGRPPPLHLQPRLAAPFADAEGPEAAVPRGRAYGGGPPPPASFRVRRAESLLHASMRTLHDWYTQFEARTACCQRRGTVSATVLAICNGVLATLSSMPFMQAGSDSWSSSRAAFAVAAIGAAIGLVALVTQALTKLGEWDAGRVQCALATQRCLGLHAQVAKDLATADGDEDLAQILAYLLDEMVSIHQCEAVRHLTRRLQPPSALPFGGSPG